MIEKLLARSTKPVTQTDYDIETLANKINELVEGVNKLKEVSHKREPFRHGDFPNGGGGC